MSEHSLRHTTLVFIIQVLFDATFMLNCSRFIGFCRKFYLLSSITQNEHLWNSLSSRAFMLNIAAFSRKLIFEWRDFRLPLSTSKQFCQDFWREVFHAGYAVRTWNFFWFVRENSCSNFFPRPLILNFHSTFWHHIFFRQHLHNLISEGKTNLWAEYNDGCVQRGGIHSLLFVIYLLNNFHIFVE